MRKAIKIFSFIFIMLLMTFILKNSLSAQSSLGGGCWLLNPPLKITQITASDNDRIFFCTENYAGYTCFWTKNKEGNLDFIKKAIGSGHNEYSISYRPNQSITSSGRIYYYTYGIQCPRPDLGLGDTMVIHSFE
jgi:hypothetical protein